MESEEQKFKNTLWDREIKQETDDFFENIKEESIEEEEYSELIIPKQETKELLENIKTEPIEKENSEKMILKLEEVQEQSILYVSNNPIQNVYIPKFNVEPQSKSITRWCTVCLQKQTSSNMKNVTMEEDKFVIIVGCVLRNYYSLDQAQSFMSEWRRVYICYTHFSEAINKIYEVPNIHNFFEFTSSLSELKKKLMVIVKALNSQIRTLQFCGILRKFVQRNNKKQKRERIITRGALNKKQHNYRCSVCTQKLSSTNMKYVTMETEKLVIMVGCLLRGESTIEKAQFIVFTKCQTQIFVCRIHFSEALVEIYKAQYQ